MSQTVTHTDIFPTVCDLLELRAPPGLQGLSLLPAIKGKKLAERPSLAVAAPNNGFETDWQDADSPGVARGGSRAVLAGMPQIDPDDRRRFIMDGKASGRVLSAPASISMRITRQDGSTPQRHQSAGGNRARVFRA